MKVKPKRLIGAVLAVSMLWAIAVAPFCEKSYATELAPSEETVQTQPLEKPLEADSSVIEEEERLLSQTTPLEQQDPLICDFESIADESTQSDMQSDSITDGEAFVEGQTTEDESNYQAIESEIESEIEPDLVQEVAPEQADSSLEQETELQDKLTAQSLLPLKEMKASFILGGNRSTVELSTILDNLLDSEGQTIKVDSSAKVVWSFYKDSQGNVIQDEYHEIKRNEMIDLSLFQNTNQYTMELIVGDGNQLNPNNVRYIVTVYLSDDIAEWRTYELYTQDADGTRHKVKIKDSARIDTSLYGENGVSQQLIVPEHINGTEYYLGVHSVLEEHPYVKVYVTDAMSYISWKLYASFGLSSVPNNINSQILNLDMSKKDAGYKNNWDRYTNSWDALSYAKSLCFIYQNTKTGKILSTEVVTFSVVSDTAYFYDEMYTQNNGQAVDVKLTSENIFEFNPSTSTPWLTVEMGKEVEAGVRYHCLWLKNGYSANKKYYYVLNAHSQIWDNANAHVVKAVAGRYSTLNAASGAKDIKDKLIPSTRGKADGYYANYGAESGGQYFSVFFDDGTAFQFHVVALNYDKSRDTEQIRQFTSAPIVGEKDPWFRVTGAKDSRGNLLDTYVVENGKAMNMDTMYGYGYQTVFINDKDVDLSKLQPVIWNPDENRIKIYSKGKLFQAGDTVDASNGAVQFTVIIDGHQKNYLVTFQKKQSNAGLFVTGSSTHEVFLDEYFEYKHDILLANLSEKQLTGLKVKLNATNCKLDDYWTVGGTGNQTLAGFTQTDSDAQYGELANLAKIRLLPDGEGEIKGTLTISASGIAPIVINLTGQAQNPQITTTSVDDAVKYVPYSHVITTSNMYDWTETSFSLVSGVLPDGVTLIESTGEIYGVPKEIGEFPITIRADFSSETYSFESSTISLTLTVKDNTDTNVYEQNYKGYEILDHIGTNVGNYHFILEQISGNVIFRSVAPFDEFVDVWLNGEKLIRDVDYEAESGSTKITLYEQTMANKTNHNGTNTIATESHTNDDKKKLNTSSQNFDINTTSSKSQMLACTVTLQKSSYTYNGKAQKPTVTVKHSSGTLKKGSDYTLTYQNNTNAGTASVEVAGAGKYTGKITKYFTIAPASQKITVKSAKVTVEQKKTVNLSATAKTALTYASSNTKIVTVDSTGKVKGVGVGNATITITTKQSDNYKQATETVDVTVKKSQPLNVSPTAQSYNATAVKKKVQSFTIKATKAQGKVTYKSSNTKYVTVTSKGKVTVKKGIPKGKYTITVTAAGNSNYNSGSKTVTITVK